MLATVAVLVSGDREHLGRMRWGWWWLLARRLPGQILTDTPRVVGAALGPSPPSGGFVRVPFDPGSDRPASGSRRALVTAGGSVSPNAFVARIDREQGKVLIHQLVRTHSPPGHGDPLWPI